ncbi:sentrin-specific protease 1-like isoform X2 [Mytilus californianus]|uniref:sentrin-specific protease 1-like isoform X2 n=1 Tax=Mytilus californianus TaxID=6549 RepID=UPI00224594EA|nr:sentrin-specific protease 1-like isoform X2 [Mytilus californianus]
MFNSFTNKFKSFIFSPQAGNSRKRKRPIDESDDTDCEIIDVKRPKSSEQNPQLGYNFFAKMADWVKSKSTWSSMFDFKTKEQSKRNGNLHQNFTSDGDLEVSGKHNGNRIPVAKRSNQGQTNYGKSQIKVKDERSDHASSEILSYNGNSQETGGNYRRDGDIINGDGRETPPDDIIQGPGPGYQQIGRKSYASVVKGSMEPNSSGQDSIKQTNHRPGSDKRKQRSLFEKKKPEVLFTATETVRLDEKERYKMLLQQYTSVPLKSSQTDNDVNQDYWPSVNKSKSHRSEESLLGNRTNHYVTKIDISKDIPRHKMTPKYIQHPPGSSMLERHVSPIEMIRKTSLSSSTVQTPTSLPQRPLLESTRLPETSMSELFTNEQSQTGRKTSPERESMIERSKRISTANKDYRSSQYLSDSWVSEIMSKYSSSARDRTRKIAEAELKAKLYEERRKGKDDDLEKRLRIQMRLYEKEPAVTEDLPVELSEEEEEKEEVLPEITPEMDDVINKALRGQPAHEVLVEGYRIQITRGDIATLAGLNWLNDEVINFYMNMLMERGEKDNYPKCYAFNTFFYPKIMSGGHSTVRRWTKKVDIFSYDYLIVPVHLGMHWCLCIVDFKKKCIQYYDSMGGQNVKCLNAVKQYLCDECKDKKNQQFDQTGWSTEIAEDIPQQMNGSDCGMFACKFADYITREANITFEQKHMSYFRRRMVYEIVKKNLLQ